MEPQRRPRARHASGDPDHAAPGPSPTAAAGFAPAPGALALDEGVAVVGVCRRLSLSSPGSSRSAPARWSCCVPLPTRRDRPLDSKRWSAVRAIVEDALDLPDAERGAFIDGACADDAELRRAVERLVDADSRPDRITRIVEEQQRDALADTAVAADFTGRRVGRYQLRRLIATGGMGAVYEAEQSEPSRLVALKTMGFGLHTADAVQRFRYESEILARLSHPAIAQVYETGTLDGPDDGEVAFASVPWFAMEYVEGARDIVQYVREEALPRDALLDLFLQVCDAVHHGHLKGVIHRDLKPGNILVDRAGRPKVIDFGVARVSDAEGGSGVHTRAGHMVGTPQYMSPEQFAGEPGAIDTRSDVYALGLLLFELLCGQRPYDLADKPIAEAAHLVEVLGARRLRSVDPLQPSDLEWICDKALARERERRYDTAADLAADIRRHRRREPVLAGPPTTIYRVSRFVSRHRVGVISASLVLLALVGGLVGTWVGLQREAEQLRRSRALAGFLGSMFRSMTPDGRGPDARVVDVLEDASWRVQREFADDPVIQADILDALGRAYADVSLREQAERLLRSALAVRTEELSVDDPERLATLGVLSDVLARRGQMAEAEGMLREGLTVHRARADGDPWLEVRLMANLGRVLLMQEQVQESEQELLAARALHDRLRAAEQRSGGVPGGAGLADEIENTLRSLYLQQGRHADVQALIVPHVEQFAERLGVSLPPGLWESVVASLETEPDESLRERTEAGVLMLETLRVAADDGSPLLLYDAWQLAYEYGRFLFDLQDDTLSLSIMEEVLVLAPRVWGPDSIKSDSVLRYIALARGRLGDGEGAVAALSESVRILERHPGAYTAAKIERMLDMADIHTRLGDHEAAAEECRGALVHDHLLPEGDFLRAKIRLSLGIALTQLGDNEAAESALLEGYELSNEHLGPDHRMTGWAIEFTAWHYEATERWEDADVWRQMQRQRAEP